MPATGLPEEWTGALHIHTGNGQGTVAEVVSAARRAGLPGAAPAITARIIGTTMGLVVSYWGWRGMVESWFPPNYPRGL